MYGCVTSWKFYLNGENIKKIFDFSTSKVAEKKTDNFAGKSNPCSENEMENVVLITCEYAKIKFLQANSKFLLTVTCSMLKFLNLLS